MDSELIHWKVRGFSAKWHGFDCEFDPAVDWTATWQHAVGAVPHACGGRALTDAVDRVHGSLWTDNTLNRYDVISTVRARSGGEGCSGYLPTVARHLWRALHCRRRGKLSDGCRDGICIHPRPSRMHLREAWNLMNSLGYRTGTGITLGWRSPRRQNGRWWLMFYATSF